MELPDMGKDYGGGKDLSLNPDLSFTLKSLPLKYNLPLLHPSPHNPT